MARQSKGWFWMILASIAFVLIFFGACARTLHTKNTFPFITWGNQSGTGTLTQSAEGGDDPRVLEADPEIRVGDLDVEKVVPQEDQQQPQQGTAQQQGTTTPQQGATVEQYGRLHEVFINPSIKPNGGDYANNVIAFGSLFMGTPYQYGSNRKDPSTFDCSDFTHYAYLGALGLDLPTDSRAQYKYVQAFGKRKYTDIRQAKRGDLLFFIDYKGSSRDHYVTASKDPSRISHVGIYLGNGAMLHTASKATGGVHITKNIFGTQYEWRFTGGGSVF